MIVGADRIRMSYLTGKARVRPLGILLHKAMGCGSKGNARSQTEAWVLCGIPNASISRGKKTLS